MKPALLILFCAAVGWAKNPYINQNPIDISSKTTVFVPSKSVPTSVDASTIALLNVYDFAVPVASETINISVPRKHPCVPVNDNTGWITAYWVYQKGWVLPKEICVEVRKK